MAPEGRLDSGERFGALRPSLENGGGHRRLSESHPLKPLERLPIGCKSGVSAPDGDRPHAIRQGATASRVHRSTAHPRPCRTGVRLRVVVSRQGNRLDVHGLWRRRQRQRPHRRDPDHGPRDADERPARVREPHAIAPAEQRREHAAGAVLHPRNRSGGRYRRRGHRGVPAAPRHRLHGWRWTTTRASRRPNRSSPSRSS